MGKYYTETYTNLYHGTDSASAESIKEKGFEIRGDDSSWCGKGVYCYDIKAKAYWSANRTCDAIKQTTGQKIEPSIIKVNILELPRNDIFDLRAYNSLLEFRKWLDPQLASSKQKVEPDDMEGMIRLRAMLIDYYAQKTRKKLVVGIFNQRPRKEYIELSDDMKKWGIVLGVETIFCVKDTSIITIQ